MSQKISPNIQQLHYRFSAYGRNAREWMRKCALMLPEIERERVWEKKGFESIYVYAGKLAGMSHASVDEALRVLKKIEDKPALMEIAERFGINAIRPVAVIATAETAEFWAEKARNMSVRTLETYVHDMREQGIATNFLHVEEITSEKVDLHAEVSPELATKLQKLKGNDDWETLFQEFIEMREKMLDEKCPESTETSSRHIPVEIQRFIIARSRGICEFQKCTKEYAILHHTQRFTLEKVHDPERIIALCTAHERIVHQGLIEDEEEKPKTWRIQQEPDQEKPTYAVDRMVMKYRRPK